MKRTLRLARPDLGGQQVHLTRFLLHKTASGAPRRLRSTLNPQGLWFASRPALSEFCALLNQLHMQLSTMTMQLPCKPVCLDQRL